MVRKPKWVGVDPDTHKRMKQIARLRRWSLRVVADEAVKLLERNATSNSDSVP